MIWLLSFNLNVDSVLARLRWVPDSGTMLMALPADSETLSVRAIYSFSEGEKGRSFEIKVIPQEGEDTLVLSREAGSDSSLLRWGSQLLWLPFGGTQDTSSALELVVDSAFVSGGDTMCVLKSAEGTPFKALVNYSRGELVKSELVLPWGVVKSFYGYSQGRLSSVKVVTPEGATVDLRFSPH